MGKICAAILKQYVERRRACGRKRGVPDTAVGAWVGLMIVAAICGGCAQSEARNALHRSPASPRASIATSAVQLDPLARGAGGTARSDAGSHRSRTLIRKSVPGGSVLTIRGKRQTFAGRSYFDLTAELEVPGRPGPAGGGSGTLSARVPERAALSVQLQTRCAGSHAYVIVYGVLRRQNDTVVALSGREQRILRRESIPKGLGAGGVLVYGVLRWMPTNVVVRGRDGSTVLNESYGGLPPERCPGGQGGTIGTIG
jgi:hypothetical protein